MIDKVLTHKGYSTLFVLVGGVAIIGLFDVVLQYLRTYVLSHTTNRIDVELGQKLFAHLLRLPLAYFETRAAGQTVARIREAGSYASVSQVVAALHADGNGGTMLSLGNSGSIDFAGTAAIQLHASNFKIG